MASALRILPADPVGAGPDADKHARGIGGLLLQLYERGMMEGEPPPAELQLFPLDELEGMDTGEESH